MPELLNFALSIGPAGNRRGGAVSRTPEYTGERLDMAIEEKGRQLRT